MFGGKPTDLIQSVSRALRILEAVGDGQGGLTAKEVAYRCDLAVPTAYHLLRTLSYEGYLIRRPGGQYQLGMQIADRFKDLLSSMDRPPRIHEVLRTVAEATGHTAYFAQVVDGHVVLTDLFEGPHSPHLEDLIPGFDEGAHATALGKALLSTISAPARKALIAEQGMRPFTDHTITDAASLYHEIDNSARRGVFTEEEQYRPDVCCGAIVVGDHGAIGLSAPAEHWKRFAPALLNVLSTRAGDLARPAPVAPAGPTQN